MLVMFIMTLDPGHYLAGWPALSLDLAQHTVHQLEYVRIIFSI